MTSPATLESKVVGYLVHGNSIGPSRLINGVLDQDSVLAGVSVLGKFDLQRLGVGGQPGGEVETHGGFHCE